MAGFWDKLSTINSFLRTVLALAAVGAISFASYLGYNTYNAKDLAVQQKEKALIEARLQLEDKSKEIAKQAVQIVSLGKEVADLKVENERLNTRIALLKVDHRLARVRVIDQVIDRDTGKPFSKIEFEELNDEGQRIGEPQEFTLRGKVIFVDSNIVKFDDKYVEQADIDRATSLVLFNRIFGEEQQPIDGFPIDKVGGAPGAYNRGGQMTEFEKKIWNDFWSIANDPAKAREMGIRAAHGQAVSMKVEKGKTYRIQLRASDGLSIVPEEMPPDSPPK